jgi:hypothetical protein
MIIHNVLLEADRLRAESVQPTPVMVAKAHYCGIEACDVFAKKFLNPVLGTQLSLSEREAVIVGLYYRIIAYCRSLLVLNKATHFQSVASATRSILEIYLDMEILHRDVFADGAMRIVSFTEMQKLKAAKKTLKFFEDNPQFDPSPSPIDTLRDYVKNNETRINAQTENLWGKDRKGKLKAPEHWTERDLKGRAVVLGKSFELLVNEGYDQRNFLVHTGLAGVAGLNSTHFTILCALSYKTVNECLLGAFRVLVSELNMKATLEPFDEQLEQLRRIPAWVLLDEALKSLGEPGRFTIEI